MSLSFVGRSFAGNEHPLSRRTAVSMEKERACARRSRKKKVQMRESHDDKLKPKNTVEPQVAAQEYGTRIPILWRVYRQTLPASGSTKGKFPTL